MLISRLVFETIAFKTKEARLELVLVQVFEYSFLFLRKWLSKFENGHFLLLLFLFTLYRM